jgi:hypothetical protein
VAGDFIMASDAKQNEKVVPGFFKHKPLIDVISRKDRRAKLAAKARRRKATKLSLHRKS